MCGRVFTKNHLQLNAHKKTHSRGERNLELMETDIVKSTDNTAPPPFTLPPHISHWSMRCVDFFCDWLFTKLRSCFKSSELYPFFSQHSQFHYHATMPFGTPVAASSLQRLQKLLHKTSTDTYFFYNFSQKIWCIYLAKCITSYKKSN